MTEPLEPPREVPHWVDNAPEPAAPATSQVPPNDLDAETALLGAALMDIEAATITASVPGDAWYSPAHSFVAEAVSVLLDREEVIDPVTVWDQLKRAGVDDAIGGYHTLTRLMAACESTSGAKSYRRIILEHHTSRMLLAAAGEIAYAAYEGDTGRAISFAEKALDALGGDGGTVAIGDAVIRHMELVEARQSGEVLSIPTGLVDLDRLMGGFRPGCFYVIAARPAMGKSALASQLTLNIARSGTRVLFATLEMSESELLDRFMANVGRVPHEHIRDGKMTAGEFERYLKAGAQVATWPIDILDQAEATMAEVRAEARHTKAEVVVVDYLTLAKPTGKHGNRQEEVAHLAVSGKRMARSLGIPVIALAQLNRGVEQRAEKRPLLSDLRESGEIEQSADGVLMLYRDEYYDPSSQDAGLMEIALQKHRHGPKGVVTAAFLAEIQAVANVAHEGNRRVA